MSAAPLSNCESDDALGLRRRSVSEDCCDVNPTLGSSPDRRPRHSSWPTLATLPESPIPSWVSSSLPLLEGSVHFHPFADLDNQPQIPVPGSPQIGFGGVTTCAVVLEDSEAPQAPYVMAGALSLIFGVLSVVPYNMVLQSDPGSPMCISFATHIFFVAINAPKLRGILFKRKIPLLYHLGFVTLGFLFTALKSSAFTRLPTSLCMLLLNLQMLVAMVMQALVFGDRYSFAQLSGCALVTLGVIAGGSTGKEQAATAADMDLGSGALIGVAQMLGAVVALTALSMLVKVAFRRFGEAVEEQLVMQHLGALPLFFLGGQWSLIGPRLVSWTVGGDFFLVLLLLVNMSVTFVSRAAQTRFAGRAPNLLLVQLVATVQKFATILVTALMAAPPMPPLRFWGGSLILIVGTLQFLSASAAQTGGDRSSGNESQKYGERSPTAASSNRRPTVFEAKKGI